MPDQIIFTHEEELTENNLTVSNLPKDIQMNVFNFNRAKEKYNQMPDGEEKTNQLNSLKKKSIILADAILTFIERELPDGEENQNQNLNNMNEELIKRAQAVGLPETATEQEVIDAETKLAATQALAERAKAVGLAETATEEEIIAAEKAKTPPADADEAAKKAKQEEEARLAAEAKKKEEENKPKKFDVMTAFDIL